MSCVREPDLTEDRHVRSARRGQDPLSARCPAVYLWDHVHLLVALSHYFPSPQQMEIFCKSSMAITKGLYVTLFGTVFLHVVNLGSTIQGLTHLSFRISFQVSP